MVIPFIIYHITNNSKEPSKDPPINDVVKSEKDKKLSTVILEFLNLFKQLVFLVLIFIFYNHDLIEINHF